MKKTIIAISTVAVSLGAIDFDGLRLESIKDENKKTNSYAVLPISYNDSLSSEIEYKTDTTIRENERVNNASTSDKDTTIDHSLLKLNLLNYKIKKSDSKYSFGIGLQQEKFDKSQVGYANSGAVNINFDHNMDIKVQSVYLKTQAIFYNDLANSKISLSVVPSSKLKVTQNTILAGTTNSTGSGSSEETLKTSYEIGLELMSSGNGLIQFGVEGNYRFLPLKYDLQLANSDNSYTTQKYDVEEKTTFVAGRLYLNPSFLAGFMPTIGFGQETIKGTNKIDNSTYTIANNKVIFGFNTKF